jgi:LCP family protein required for cell wall assembly
MRKFIIGLSFGILVLVGCIPVIPPVNESTNLPNQGAIITNLSTTTTITSNQLIVPTFTQHSTNNFNLTETPTIKPDPTSHTVVHLRLPRPSNQVNILLLGSDYRPKMGFNTDIMMVLSLNLEKRTATLVSFPRDLYVNIPGFGMNRINASQAFGGFELTAATIKENFDFDVDYFIMTNFSGFRLIVDTLGGITVNAGAELNDTCTLPQAENKMCHISAGETTMDGATALWYVRSRYTTNDFDRTRRAQEVITAIFKKAMTLDAINRGPELYDLLIKCVETNLSMDMVMQLLPISSHLIDNPSLVERYSIGPSNVTNYTVPGSGAMVFIPDPISIAEIIRQAFYQE